MASQYPRAYTSITSLCFAESLLQTVSSNTSINHRDAKHLRWLASVRFDLIVCFSMGTYKGVLVLDDLQDVDFLVWKPLALGFFEKHHPSTAELLLKHADELEDGIVRGSGNDPAVQKADRAAAARHDELAKGHITLLLGPTMQSQLLHLSRRRELWDKLEEQFGLWEDCQGPVWQREWRQIGSLRLDGVGAYSRRAEALAVKLGRAGRPVPETSLVDDVLDGLIRERPE
jgi:hypothetical protein